MTKINFDKEFNKEFDEIVNKYNLSDDTCYQTLYYVMLHYFIEIIAFLRDPMVLFDKIKISEVTIKFYKHNDKRPHVWLSYTGFLTPDPKRDIDVVFPWDERSESFANQLSCKAMCSFFILAYVTDKNNYDREDVLIKCVKMIVSIYKNIKITTSKSAIQSIPLLRSYDAMQNYNKMISRILSRSL